jgi:hypothetical protein
LYLLLAQLVVDEHPLKAKQPLHFLLLLLLLLLLLPVCAATAAPAKATLQPPPFRPVQRTRVDNYPTVRIRRLPRQPHNFRVEPAAREMGWGGGGTAHRVNINATRFLLGTSWTVRIAMLMYKEEEEEKKLAAR